MLTILLLITGAPPTLKNVAVIPTIVIADDLIHMGAAITTKRAVALVPMMATAHGGRGI